MGRNFAMYEIIIQSSANKFWYHQNSIQIGAGLNIVGTYIPVDIMWLKICRRPFSAFAVKEVAQFYVKSWSKKVFQVRSKKLFEKSFWSEVEKVVRKKFFKWGRKESFARHGPDWLTIKLWNSRCRVLTWKKLQFLSSLSKKGSHVLFIWQCWNEQIVSQALRILMDWGQQCG
jgi:hypothetical protein